MSSVISKYLNRRCCFRNEFLKQRPNISHCNITTPDWNMCIATMSTVVNMQVFDNITVLREQCSYPTYPCFKICVSNIKTDCATDIINGLPDTLKCEITGISSCFKTDSDIMYTPNFNEVI